jgi:hypothetical protein
VDSVSSHHMTGMRSLFLMFSENDTNCYVGSGTNTRQAIRRYGYVRFQIKSGGFMGIEHMLYAIYFKENLLLIAEFEYEVYAVASQNGQVLVYSREVALDTTIVLGIRKERLYRLLGRPIVWSNGLLDSILDTKSYSMSYSTSMSEALSDIGSCEGRMSP